jgi:DNA polymerase-3 subunit beta
VPSRSPKPILQNVLLSEGMLTATDLELTIQTPLMWEGDPIVLPHARLTAILATANADEVTLTPDGDSVTIQAGGGTWRLPTEDAKEYPPRSSLATEATSIGRLPCSQLRSLLAAVKFATDNESSRYALGAVCVEFKDGELSFVGTDGRRMAVASCEIDQSLDESQTLIPRRVVDVLYRLATGEDAIQLERTDTEVIATVGDTVVSARQVEGRYPRWRDVEPTRDHVRPSLVQVGPLLHACEMAAICSSEDSKGTSWGFTDEGIFITARSSQFGESSATCDVVEAGTSTVVNIDPRFALEWLRTLDEAETVEVEAENAESAIVFRAGDLRNVVMPLAKD